MGHLRVAVGETELRVEHARIMKSLLQRGRHRPELQSGERIEGFSDEVMGVARSLWRARMIREHSSAAVWSGLLPQLIAAEATLDVKLVILRAAMEELRHAALCGDVMVALGVPAEAELDLAPEPMPSHPDCPPIEGALRNLLVVGCLAETVAVAVTAEERQHDTHPYIGRVLDQLHADETGHGRIGWIFVKDTWPRLDEAGRQRTNAYLRVALAHLERRELAGLPERATPNAETLRQMRALGVSDSNECRELFYEVVEDVIIVQLEAVGLDARAAWQARPPIDAS